MIVAVRDSSSSERKVIGYYTLLPCGLSRVRASLVHSCIVYIRDNAPGVLCVAHRPQPFGAFPYLPPPKRGPRIFLFRPRFVLWV